MQFLKTLFWVMIAVVAVIFSFRNWLTVTVNLWGGLAADVQLPILLLFAFLIGFIPAFLLYRTTRWRLRRKLENVQRALEEARTQAGIVSPSLVVPSAPTGGTIDPAPIGPPSSSL